jgi:hypothetical protein
VNTQREADIALSKTMSYWNVLYNRYGLFKTDYDNMLDDQNGRCAICQTGIRGTDTNGKRLAFVDHDHDHETKEVRGLLCHACNAGIGLFKESVRRLASAIVYLEEHGKIFL